MRWAIAVAGMLLLSGCSGKANHDTSNPTTTCPDTCALTTHPTNPGTTSGGTTTGNTTTPGGDGNGTAGNTTATPGAATVNGETRLTFAFSGAGVRSVNLTAPTAFTVDDVNHEPTGSGGGGSGTIVTYGIALWPAGGPALAPPCTDGAPLLVWDARTHAATLGWDEVPAGNYTLWVWNEEADDVSIEFNGASTNTDPTSVDALAINWTATQVDPTLSTVSPAQSTQTFTQTVTVAKQAYLAVRYAPPSGQPDASSSTTISAGSTECSKAESPAPATPNVFATTTLRASAILGPGDATWSGEFSATAAPFGGFSGGTAVGLLLSET